MEISNYVTGGSGKGRPVTKALPIVVIPTTAGTGTEADPWAVITNEENKKRSVLDAVLLSQLFLSLIRN